MTLGNVLAKAATTKSGGSVTIIFIVAIFAIGYFLLIRPQRRRTRAMQQNQQTIQVGDEVMLTSGIIGQVTWLEGDRAGLEIAPGIHVEVVRAAIARQVPAPVADDDIAVHPDDEPVHPDDEHDGSDLPEDGHALEDGHAPEGHGTTPGSSAPESGAGHDGDGKEAS